MTGLPAICVEPIPQQRARGAATSSPYTPERPSGSRATGDAKHVVDTGGSSAVGGRVDDKTSQDRGALQPTAAKVLMKILYAARMARFDLLRAVCHLACFITKWTPECDKRPHRLVC